MADDKITDQVLSGSEYERTKAVVRRTFPMSLRWKVRTAILGLLVTALIAPAVSLRQAFILELEGTETFRLEIGKLAMLGILTTLGAGLLLVKQEYVLTQGSVTAERARRLVRIEDLLMWFVLLGTVFTVLSTVLVVVGVVSTEAIERLYGASVRVYRPSDAAGVDVRLVSGLGPGLAIVLLVLHTSIQSNN